MIPSSRLQVAPENAPRTRRPKTILREKQLQERLANAKRQLRVLQAQETTIQRLGDLAYEAGLAILSDEVLRSEFAAIAKRLLGIVLLTCSLVLLPGCVPVGDQSIVASPSTFDIATIDMVAGHVSHQSQTMTLTNGQTITVHVWDGDPLTQPYRQATCRGSSTELNTALCDNVVQYWNRAHPAANDFSFPASLVPKNFFGM